MQLTYDVEGNATIEDQNGMTIADTPYDGIQDEGDVIDKEAQLSYTEAFYYHRSAKNRDLRLVNNDTSANLHMTGKIIKVFGKSSNELANGDTTFQIKVNDNTVFEITNTGNNESFELYPDIGVVTGDALKVRVVGESITKPIVYVTIQR